MVLGRTTASSSSATTKLAGQIGAVVAAGPRVGALRGRRWRRWWDVVVIHLTVISLSMVHQRLLGSGALKASVPNVVVVVAVVVGVVELRVVRIVVVHAIVKSVGIAAVVLQVLCVLGGSSQIVAVAVVAQAKVEGVGTIVSTIKVVATAVGGRRKVLRW